MHIVNGDVSNADEKLVVTVTGEYVQPVRLYYRLKDKRAVKKVFSKLKCMDYDAGRDRYVWLYQKEAKKLTFKYPYSAVPAEQRPVVIGSFFSESVDEMYLEIRSIERALEGIVFSMRTSNPIWLVSIRSALLTSYFRLLSTQWIFPIISIKR